MSHVDTTSGTPWLLRAKVSTLRVLWEVPTWPQAGGGLGPLKPRVCHLGSEVIPTTSRTQPLRVHPTWPELRTQRSSATSRSRPDPAPHVRPPPWRRVLSLLPGTEKAPQHKSGESMCETGLGGVAGDPRRGGARDGKRRLYSTTQNPRGREQRDGGTGEGGHQDPARHRGI